MSQTLSSQAIKALRAATHTAHHTLDSMLPLARADAALEDYANHLAVLKDWQTSLAPWLSRSVMDAHDLALLELDLADCQNAGCPPADLDMEGECRVLSADDGSSAFCWGVAYVLEGSKLGGQVLYRRLHERLHPHSLRYLGTRAAHGPAWPQFLAQLERQLPDEASRRSACRGAVAAFESLTGRFRRVGCLV